MASLCLRLIICVSALEWTWGSSDIRMLNTPCRLCHPILPYWYTYALRQKREGRGLKEPESLGHQKRLWAWFAVLKARGGYTFQLQRHGMLWDKDRERIVCQTF